MKKFFKSIGEFLFGSETVESVNGRCTGHSSFWDDTPPDHTNGCPGSKAVPVGTDPSKARPVAAVEVHGVTPAAQRKADKALAAKLARSYSKSIRKNYRGIRVMEEQDCPAVTPKPPKGPSASANVKPKRKKKVTSKPSAKKQVTKKKIVRKKKRAA